MEGAIKAQKSGGSNEQLRKIDGVKYLIKACVYFLSNFYFITKW